MLTPVHEPLASADATEAVREIVCQGSHHMWFLWPFKLMITTYPTGSRVWVLEFRPFMKFAVNIGFFWKAPGA
jgi:hypothetical protein